MDSEGDSNPSPSIISGGSGIFQTGGSGVGTCNLANLPKKMHWGMFPAGYEIHKYFRMLPWVPNTNMYKNQEKSVNWCRFHIMIDNRFHLTGSEFV